jgi:ribosomal protein S18 acetylase RimI-like enzyme
VNLALGNEVFQRNGATFVRNTSHPIIHDANHVTGITASTPEEIDALLDRVERQYAHCRHRRFDTDVRTPPQFVTRLSLDGYTPEHALLLLLVDGVIGTPRKHDIRPLESESDWAEFTLLRRMDWEEHAARTGRPAEREVNDSMTALRFVKQPPVLYWGAWVDGRPVAYLNSWEGPEGVGQIEDVFTHPDYRHRGLATSLIHHGVADARGKGAGAVAIVADPTDTPKHMYAAIGFRPFAVLTHYFTRLLTPTEGRSAGGQYSTPTTTAG